MTPVGAWRALKVALLALALAWSGAEAARHRRCAEHLKPATEHLQEMGLVISEPVAGLAFNGGIAFPLTNFLGHLQDRREGRSARFELAVARFAAARGERILGLGDESVRDVLYPGRRDANGQIVLQNDKGADLLTVEPDLRGPIFSIREMKSSRGHYLGIKEARLQVMTTLRQLLERVPRARIGSLEVVTPTRTEAHLQELIRRQDLVAVDEAAGLYQSQDPGKHSIQGIPFYVRFLQFDDRGPEAQFPARFRHP